jgi:hypothetical protein
VLGGALLEWEGETAIEPPPAARNAQLRLDDNWSAEGLRAPKAHFVAPDAVLEIARNDGDGSCLFLIEYDRTTRVDKNYEKFCRYDAFLTCWWRHTFVLDRGEAPWVLFVCQNETHRDKSSPPLTATSPATSGTPPSTPGRSTTPDAAASSSPARPTSTAACSKRAESPATHRATTPGGGHSPRRGEYGYRARDESSIFGRTRIRCRQSSSCGRGHEVR